MQVDHNRLLPASHDICFYRLIASGIEFLVRHIRRHVNEVPGAGLVHKFQMVSPSKSRAPSNDIEHRFQLSMVMRTCLGVGVHDDSSRPEFLRPDPRVRDGFGARHTWGLRGVRIQLAASNNSNALLFPVRFLIRIWIGPTLLLYLQQSPLTSLLPTHP